MSAVMGVGMGVGLGVGIFGEGEPGGVRVMCVYDEGSEEGFFRGRGGGHGVGLEMLTLKMVVLMGLRRVGMGCCECRWNREKAMGKRCIPFK